MYPERLPGLGERATPLPSSSREEKTQTFARKSLEKSSTEADRALRPGGTTGLSFSSTGSESCWACAHHRAGEPFLSALSSPRQGWGLTPFETNRRTAIGTPSTPQPQPLIIVSSSGTALFHVCFHMAWHPWGHAEGAEGAQVQCRRMATVRLPPTLTGLTITSIYEYKALCSQTSEKQQDGNVEGNQETRKQREPCRRKTTAGEATSFLRACGEPGTRHLFACSGTFSPPNSPWT